jgi:hypothetical protein
MAQSQFICDGSLKSEIAMPNRYDQSTNAFATNTSDTATLYTPFGGAPSLIGASAISNISPTAPISKSSAVRAVSSTRRAIINGIAAEFANDEAKFNSLVAECRRLRDDGSSTDTVFNDAYGQIVGMGPAAIPFLLRELRKQSGHWITALTWIAGVELVTPDIRGDQRKMREAWLNWGSRNGYHVRD